MTKPPTLFKSTSALLAFILGVPESAIVFKKQKLANFKPVTNKTEDGNVLNYLLYKTSTNKQLTRVENLSENTALKPLIDVSCTIKSFIGLPIHGLKKDEICIFYVIYDTETHFNKRQIEALEAALKQASELLKKNDSLQTEKTKQKKLTPQLKEQGSKIAEAGTWTWNVKTGALVFNERYAEMLGYTLSEMQPLSFKTWEDLLHPEDEKPAKDALQACFLKKIKVYNFNFRLLHKNGYYVWINSCGSIVEWTKDHQPLIMAGSHFDISSQIQSDESMRKNIWPLEENYGLSKTGSCSFELETKSFLYSKGLSEIFEIESELPYDTLLNYIIEKDKALVLKTKQDCIAIGKSYHITYRIKSANGTLKIIDEQGTGVKNNIGEVISINSTLHDVTEKKKEEQHLKLLESVILNTTDSVLITEAEPFDEPGPKIIYVNDAFTKMTGYSAEEVIGKTPRILQGPKSNKTELKKLSKAIRNWESYNMTTVNYKKNGDAFWINFSVTPVADETGWYTHWIAIERDVSKDVNAINYQRLLKNISVIFNENATLDDSLKHTLQAISKHHEYSYGELWLQEPSEQEFSLISADYFNDYGKTFKQLAAKKRFSIKNSLPGEVLKEKKLIFWSDIQTNTKFVRKAFAKTAQLNAAVALPIMANDDILGVLVLMYNHKPKKSTLPLALFAELQHFLGAEIKRKNSEIEVLQVFNFAPDIITINNNKNLITKANQATVDILGYSQEELKSQSFYNFIHPDDKEKTSEQTNILRDGRPIYNFENRYISKAGNVIWLQWTATPNYTNGLTYSVAKDITELKKNQEDLLKLNENLKAYASELELSNSELEHFAYVASHDLQEPLRMVTSFLSQLERKYSNVLDKKAQTYIHYAVDGAKRMRTIILDILEYSRSGNLDEGAETIDLNLFIDDIISYFRNQITRENAKIYYTNLPEINFSRSALSQIFTNIIGNSLKYISPGRTAVIEISAKEQKNYWEFTIKDNGIGIAKEHLEKIFIIFQRLHDKAEYSGTGVGLSIVKKLVERHKGTIRVESELNEGTIFYIQLPK